MTPFSVPEHPHLQSHWLVSASSWSLRIVLQSYRKGPYLLPASENNLNRFVGPTGKAFEQRFTQCSIQGALQMLYSTTGDASEQVSDICKFYRIFCHRQERNLHPLCDCRRVSWTQFQILHVVTWAPVCKSWLLVSCASLINPSIPFTIKNIGSGLK